MRRRLKKLALVGCLGALAIGAWVLWGGWPAAVAEPLPWRPEAIVVLGGGEDARWTEALRLHHEFPEVPVIVTGDDGVIFAWLLKMKVPADRLIHEELATSTLQNATHTAPLLDAVSAKNVVLVTEWFHAPRARAVFAKIQPDRQFAISFQPRPATFSPHDIFTQRRERAAALIYLLLHRVNAFGS
jgi:uncharacterized SAM-binding protein YcdF (DUF218 family)